MKLNVSETTSETIQEAPVEEIPQTVDERINDIRAWYSQIQNIGLKNCNQKTRVKYDSFSPETEKIPFDQVANRCKISDEFEVIEGNFSGYEWSNTVHVYKKDQKIFFIFIEGGSEGWLFERRYYCDKDENVIRHLEREGNAGSEVQGPQKEMRTNNQNIRDYLKSELDELGLILREKI
ncbi:MAG: hypothetical protein EB100_00390 [Crocinitomicaceae bacterium]|nr:hypothetical protein [Crocinitomicaceae bacterium]